MSIALESSRLDADNKSMSTPMTYSERITATQKWAQGLDDTTVLAMFAHFENGKADADAAAQAVSFAVPRDTILYRGMPCDKPLQVGDILPAHATVMSTSMDREVCYAYAQVQGPGVILHIEVPKGQRTAPTWHVADRIWELVDSGEDDEDDQLEIDGCDPYRPEPGDIEGHRVEWYPGGSVAADFQCNDEWLLPQGTALRVVSTHWEREDDNEGLQVAHVVIV